MTTNIEFLRFLLADPRCRAGRLDTGLLDADRRSHAPAAAAVAGAAGTRGAGRGGWTVRVPRGWPVGAVGDAGGRWPG